MKKEKKPIEDPILETWKGLNVALLTMDEAGCRTLLKKELAGRNRRQVLKRIHSRLNKVRAHREREELKGA